MNPMVDRDLRVQVSFWVSAGLALTGGIAPLLLAVGGPNRVAGAAIPFAVAAGVMAVAALMYRQGRPLATLLYFIAGLAIVYGMLFMVATPLRLAVVNTCPAAPAPCPAGYERAFSSGEATGLNVGIAFGVLAILAGFFGLLILYRSQRKPPDIPSV